MGYCISAAASGMMSPRRAKRRSTRVPELIIAASPAGKCARIHHRYAAIGLEKGKPDRGFRHYRRSITKAHDFPYTGKLLFKGSFYTMLNRQGCTGTA
jgi:hypothetical protein